MVKGVSWQFQFFPAPLQPCATAEDVAETMMSLITGNRFVTGQVIVVDGGFSSTT